MGKKKMFMLALIGVFMGLSAFSSSHFSLVRQAGYMESEVFSLDIRETQAQHWELYE